MAKGPLAKTDDFRRVDAVFEKVHLWLGSLSLKWDHDTSQTHSNVRMETLWHTRWKQVSPSDKGGVKGERFVPQGTMISYSPTELLGELLGCGWSETQMEPNVRGLLQMQVGRESLLPVKMLAA